MAAAARRAATLSTPRMTTSRASRSVWVTRQSEVQRRGAAGGGRESRSGLEVSSISRATMRCASSQLRARASPLAGRRPRPSTVLRRLNASSIVWMQMTSPGAARAWLGRDDVADLHLGIADDHAGDEVFDQLAPLLPGRLSQAVPHPCAERFRALGEARDLRPSVDLSLELSHLSEQSPLTPLQLAPPPPVLLEPSTTTGTEAAAIQSSRGSTTRLAGTAPGGAAGALP